MSEVAVRPAGAEHAKEWDAFVGASPRSTFFHRYGWKEILCRGIGLEDHYLFAERNGTFVGLMPLVAVRSRFFGNRLCSLPFCAYAGPLAGEPDVEAALIARGVELGRKLGVDHLELRSLHRLQPASPCQELYFTFRSRIPQELESMKGLPQKRRNVVRRAVSLGLRAEVGRDPVRFHDLYAENARAHGTPALGPCFFTGLLNAFPADSDILFVTDAAGRDLSAILNFYHHDEVLAYFAGENLAARECNANDFKYWSLMKHAAARGCERFDFGRSKAGTGSFQFKRLWGFEPTQLRYEFPYLPSGVIPQLNPMNSKYRLAIRIWRVLPRPVVDRIGPMLVAALG